MYQSFSNLIISKSLEFMAELNMMNLTSIPVPNIPALNMLLFHIKKSNCYTIKVTKAKSYINANTKHACIEYAVISYKKLN